jgi:hypothetical protein
MVRATREHQSKFGLEILLVLLVKNKVFSFFELRCCEVRPQSLLY